MWKKIKCLLFGHKKYEPNALDGEDFMTINDALGEKLISIHICQRCGAIYSDFSEGILE